jgi:hypothetical protein
MTVAHYRINELDAADRVVDGYSVMCRSDTAALADGQQGCGKPGGRGRSVGEPRAMSPALTRCRHGIGSGASGPVNRLASGFVSR